MLLCGQGVGGHGFPGCLRRCLQQPNGTTLLSPGSSTSIATQAPARLRLLDDFAPEPLGSRVCVARTLSSPRGIFLVYGGVLPGLSGGSLGGATIPPRAMAGQRQVGSNRTSRTPLTSAHKRLPTAPSIAVLIFPADPEPNPLISFSPRLLIARVRPPTTPSHGSMGYANPARAIPSVTNDPLPSAHHTRQPLTAPPPIHPCTSSRNRLGASTNKCVPSCTPTQGRETPPSVPRQGTCPGRCCSRKSRPVPASPSREPCHPLATGRRRGGRYLDRPTRAATLENSDRSFRFERKTPRPPPPGLVSKAPRSTNSWPTIPRQGIDAAAEEPR